MLTYEKAQFGEFVYFESCELFSYSEFKLDINIGEFICSYRERPFFMKSMKGFGASELPLETQFLITKNNDLYTVYLPLIDSVTRSALRGGDAVYLCSETGDDAVKIKSGLGLFVILGKDIHEIIRLAMTDIKNKLGTFKLRSEKTKPEFMKYFGWCTWNALGINVRDDQLADSIATFGEYIPKFVLLDDGWQSVDKTEQGQGNWRLSSFEPKEGFNLSDCVKSCKNAGVEKFFVWHATMGYWAGVHTESPVMKKYNPQLISAKYSDNIHKNCHEAASGSENSYGLVANDKIFDFYNDYHKYIASCGVDGVKIDTQNYVEAVARGRGGRSVLSAFVREGMEASTQLNFGGELINCMCGQNDTIFRLKASNMMRTSDDFFPNVPVSHGIHIYSNAFNSLMCREITWCDWDMFMTDHEYGEYHAAARAVSGGPVYVTDKIGEHNFDIISSLRLSDGTVPLCTDVAVPSTDSVFVDPFNDKKAFKIVNTNKFGKVEAVFNMNKDGLTVDYTIPKPAYSYKNKCVTEGDFELDKAGFDILTYPDIIDGFGVYGLIEKYNSGGTVSDFKVFENVAYIELLDIGTLCAYCEQKPERVICDGDDVDFFYDDGLVTVSIKSKKVIVIK